MKQLRQHSLAINFCAVIFASFFIPFRRKNLHFAFLISNQFFHCVIIQSPKAKQQTDSVIHVEKHLVEKLNIFMHILTKAWVLPLITGVWRKILKTDEHNN